MQHHPVENNSLSLTEKVCIAFVDLSIAFENAELASKNIGRQKRNSGPKIKDRVAKIFGRSSKTVGNIYKEVHALRPLAGSGPRGNFTAKPTRIAITKRLAMKVLEFVRMERLQRKYVSAKEVTKMLISSKILPVKMEGNSRDPKDLACCDEVYAEVVEAPGIS